MPDRRRQKYEERRTQIVAGALRIFSSQGFSRTSLKEIADASGLNSPGLIYHYFKSKNDLLRAVIDEFAPPMQLLSHADEFMELLPPDALYRLGCAYLRLADDPNTLALLKLLLGEALHDPKTARTFVESGPLRVFSLLSDYLQHHMDQGRLRRTDPQLAARGFIGPLVVYLLMNRVFRIPDPSGMDPETLVSRHVEMFLNGMETTT
jgi:TetR/AcrR family transcriptional regulator, mexJK operon transcriptional repressor